MIAQDTILLSLNATFSYFLCVLAWKRGNFWNEISDLDSIYFFKEN